MKRDAIGNVRSIRTEWADWDLTSETWRPVMRVTRQEYRPDGQLEESEFQFPNSPAQRSTHLYDDGGRLVEWQNRSDGQLVGRVKYSYDAEGRVSHTTGVTQEGAEQLAEEHMYGADGRHTRVRHLPPIAGPVGYCCGVEGIEFSITTEGVRTMTTVYGPGGLEREVALADGCGEVLRRFVITRDDSGRLVKAEVFLCGKPIVPQVPAFGVDLAVVTEEYSHDAEGRRVEVRRQTFGLSEEREAYRYDDRGNRIVTTREEQSFEGAIGEDGQVQRQGAPRVNQQESRWTYRYDDRGNWIERVISQRYGDNPDFTPGAREIREITYFD